MINYGAASLRETTGTSGLDQTLRNAVSTLAECDIPHFVVGGLAVQEHGYYRVTLDVDIVVPDVLDAAEMLTADLAGPFARVPGCEDTVKDRHNNVLVNLLPAGRVPRRDCQIPFPTPTEVSSSPVIISLTDLISLKLDSWSHSPTRRLKDKADVVELIARGHLPRDLAVQPPVRQIYEETWDALQAEK
ncbi:MAG: hypothetical protein M1608_04845 [Candidatus Omnitrophica bacterium]|nr:hypothetical protein [Candidatus Omnitrophota bacterium]